MLHIIKVSLEKTEAGESRIPRKNTKRKRGRSGRKPIRNGNAGRVVFQENKREAGAAGELPPRAEGHHLFAGQNFMVSAPLRGRTRHAQGHRTIFRLFSRHGIGDREPSGGKGHVYLETNENDRRAKNVRLTEKEKITFRQIQCEHRQTEEMLLKGFSNEEKEKFSEYLERVYKNLE